MTTNPFSTVWFYNSDTGSVISEPALGDTIQSHIPGWHGPFGTKQEALDYYTSNKSANPGWKAPTGLAGNVANEASTAAGGLLKYSASVTGFSGTNFVLRAVKVIVGGVLLISGIIHLAGIDKDALGIASKAVIPA
jgi:hypothetical protein